MKIITFHVSKLKPNYKEIRTYNPQDWYFYEKIGLLDYLIRYKKNGWEINATEIIFFTRAKYKWKNLNFANKISLLSFVATVLMLILTLFMLAIMIY